MATKKEKFVVAVPWYGVSKDEIVEVEVDENGEPAHASLRPNLRAIPAEAKLTPSVPPKKTT